MQASGQSSVYWGDIHNHNEVGYGKGSLERAYDLAENALDFYAFTPHSWWPDVPTEDPAVTRKHEQGFDKTERNWDRVVGMVRDRYRPGSFVPLLGWEWHSLEWGDHCIYMPDAEGRVFRAPDKGELSAWCREHGALLIPHHVAYAERRRGFKWDTFDPERTPVVEIFSEHGDSFDAYSTRSMYSHTMGGVISSQTCLHQLKAGKRFGFTAGTDDHWGYPGDYGFGLTAVYAPELTREAVFHALRNRHTYAVTGDRIEMDARIGTAVPGDAIPASAGLQAAIRVVGRAPIAVVELLRNGEPVRTYTAQDLPRPQSAAEHFCRIEFGWDEMSSEAATVWNVEGTVTGGRLDAVEPYFCGGAAAVDRVNRLTVDGDSRFAVDCLTSRRNVHPVSGVLLRWHGDGESELTLRVAGDKQGTGFRQELKVSKEHLATGDVEIGAFDTFTAPKLKVHRILPVGGLTLDDAFTLANPRPGDFFVWRVLQRNGQMAWTSPIWLD